MIYGFHSDLTSFKDLSLGEGLNLILAKSVREESVKHTRNRAGKTSIVRLIHFLTGSYCSPSDCLFRKDELKDHVFGGDIDVGGVKVRVRRKGDSQGTLEISVLEGNPKSWQYNPFEGSTKTEVRRKTWRRILGNEFFNIPDEDEDYSPTFASLFSYLVRKVYSGAFGDPIKQHRQQATWDRRVNISFLLGLDWRIPQEFEKVRKKEQRLSKLQDSITEGEFSDIIGDVADLRTERAITLDKIESLQEDIEKFEVVDRYSDYEERADEITQRIGDLTDQNTLDRRQISEMQEALEREDPPSVDKLRKVYDSADIELPELVERRFESVKEFHESVIENRESYLRGEIEAAEQRIRERNEEIARLDEERAEIMQILESGGALEQFSRLQEELSKLQSKLESLEEKIDMANTIDKDKTELEIKRSKLKLRLQQDHEENKEKIDRAIVSFEEASKSLYKRAGQFTVEASERGPRFDVSIHGEQSKGVTNMQIFCFDMMLMKILSGRGEGPGFLVHDSHLFDGVDERQIGKAIEVGANMADKHNFQYVVTMNTDDLPDKDSIGVDIEDCIVKPILTDKEESGGLFGFRFD